MFLCGPVIFIIFTVATTLLVTSCIPNCLQCHSIMPGIKIEVEDDFIASTLIKCTPVCFILFNANQGWWKQVKEGQKNCTSKFEASRNLQSSSMSFNRESSTSLALAFGQIIFHKVYLRKPLSQHRKVVGNMLCYLQQ